MKFRDISKELAANHPLLYRFQPHVLFLSTGGSLVVSILGRMALLYFPDHNNIIAIVVYLLAGMAYTTWYAVTDDIPRVENALGFGIQLTCCETLLASALVATPPILLVPLSAFDANFVGILALIGFFIFSVIPRSFNLYFHVKESNLKADFWCWVCVILLYGFSGIVFGIDLAFLIFVPLCLASLTILMLSISRGIRTRKSWTLARYAGLLPIMLAAGAALGQLIEIPYPNFLEARYMATIIQLSLLGLGLIAFWLDFVTRLCERFRMLPFSNNSRFNLIYSKNIS